MNHLAERHLRELRDGSGLSIDTIQRRGYRSVTDARELLALGFEDYAARRVPGYLLPVTDTRGRNGRFYFKPDQPRPDPERPERVVKYESQPKRVGGVVLDIAPRSRSLQLDWRTPLLITEGQKKEDAADQLDEFCVIGVIGVWCWGWRLWKDTGEPLEDWLPILPSLKGRLVYICFDSDAIDKSGVRAAEKRLAEFLDAHGARVYIVRLPSEADGAKNGLDDYIVRHGAAAFEDLVRSARPAGESTSADELRQQVSAVGQLLYNAKLSAAEKVGVFAFATDAGWLESKDEPTPYIVNYQRVARCGLSTDTLGTVLKRLDRDGVVKKKVIREQTGDYDESGKAQFVSHVQLTPPAGGFLALVRAAARVDSERPQHGGTRVPRCPDHPDAELVRREHLLHFDCGCVVDERRLNRHLAVSEGLPAGSPIDVCNTPIFSVSEDEEEACSAGLHRGHAERSEHIARDETGDAGLRPGPGQPQQPVSRVGRRHDGGNGAVRGERDRGVRRDGPAAYVCRVCGGGLNAGEQAAGFQLHYDCALPIRAHVGEVAP